MGTLMSMALSMVWTQNWRTKISRINTSGEVLDVWVFLGCCQDLGENCIVLVSHYCLNILVRYDSTIINYKVRYDSAITNYKCTMSLILLLYHKYTRTGLEYKQMV